MFEDLIRIVAHNILSVFFLESFSEGFFFEEFANSVAARVS